MSHMWSLERGIEIQQSTDVPEIVCCLHDANGIQSKFVGMYIWLDSIQKRRETVGDTTPYQHKVSHCNDFISVL